MDNSLKVHFHCDENWHLNLTLECPLCGAEQGLDINTVNTGEEFDCECGEAIRLTVDALYPVKRELEELRHLIVKTVTLPV